MYHLATFRHEEPAEQVAGKMERSHIRTGLTDDHLKSGDTVYNLFVADYQAEDAERLLSAICEELHNEAEVMHCPNCGSAEVHPPASEDDIFPPMEFKPPGDLMLRCASCGHTWS